MDSIAFTKSLTNLLLEGRVASARPNFAASPWAALAAASAAVPGMLPLQSQIQQVDINITTCHQVDTILIWFLDKHNVDIINML